MFGRVVRSSASLLCRNATNMKVAHFNRSTMVLSQHRPFSVDADSNPAFHSIKKSVEKPGLSAELESQLREAVNSTQIVLFMKGVPSAPQCGFSNRVVQILNHLNVPYEACNILESDELREGIKVFSDWPTIPQLYINGEFIGGCDIITNMFTSGELHELLGLKKENE